MSHNKIFFSIVFLIGCSGCTLFRKDKDTVSALLEDMKHYRTTSGHRGDLWQHSIWTAQLLGRWRHNSEDPWLHDIIDPLIQQLSPRDCYVLEVAGLVHDIGKAGDLDISKYEKTTRRDDIIYYFSRENHERIGFEYIVHDLPSMKGKISRAYQKLDGNYFNFNMLFSRLYLSADDQKVIAILVGSHKTFSLLLSKPSDQVATETFRLVKSLAQEVQYVPADMKKLLSMVVLVQLADTYAAFFPVTKPGPSSLFNRDLIVSAPHEQNDKLIQTMLTKLLPQAKKFIDAVMKESLYGAVI